MDEHRSDVARFRALWNVKPAKTRSEKELRAGMRSEKESYSNVRAFSPLHMRWHAFFVVPSQRTSSFCSELPLELLDRQQSYAEVTGDIGLGKALEIL